MLVLAQNCAVLFCTLVLAQNCAVLFCVLVLAQNPRLRSTNCIFCLVLRSGLEIQNNNSIIRDNEKGTCMSIDVAISGDRNVIKKEAEKILKYKDRTIEIQRMWNVKTKVIPVIIGATGTVTMSFRKYVSKIPGKHEAKELKKTATLGTAHILRKVLM